MNLYSQLKNSVLNKLPVIAMLVTIILWSSAFVGIRYGVRYYQPESLALLRLLFASAFIIPIFLIQRRRPDRRFYGRPSRKTHIILLATGIVGLGLYNIFLNVGEQSISADAASFIISQAPIITALLAFFCLKERLSLLAIIGIMISFSGVLIIYMASANSHSSVWGMFSVILASLCAAAYFILVKYLSRYYSPMYITMTSIWYSTLLLAIFYSKALIHDFSTAPVMATWVIVYLGIFPTAIAYGSWNYALSQINASRVAAALYATPLFVVLFSYLFLHETISFYTFSGGCIALLGAVVLSKSRRRVSQPFSSVSVE